MYDDRAVTPSLFQWESQKHHVGSLTDRTALHKPPGEETNIHLFVRETKEADGDLGSPPYLYAGKANYVSHSGGRPMRILWRLEDELPAEVFAMARVAAG